MKWKDHYDSRCLTLEAAAKLIKSGDKIVLGSGCGSPESVIDAILARSKELEDVEMATMVSASKGAYSRPEHAGHILHNSYFVAPGTRKAMDEDRCEYTPIFYGSMPQSFRDGTLPCDVAIISCTPPDKAGNVSLGVSVSFDRAAALAAKTVIAEVTPKMPFTLGDAHMHVSQIDYFVPTERPMVNLPRPEIGEIERQIGGQIATLIKDGDCLQLGYGALPDAVLSFLHEKKDLGIHSEMVSDGVMQLVNSGVVTCAKKTLNPYKITICVAMGSAEFYDWIHYNSMIDMHPVEYTNSPSVIGQNDNMVSINSALTVDLLGQVAADMRGPNQYSGIGGQLDFVRGCRLSKGGRSIIALESTAQKGTVSRLTATLAPGQAVTTSRHDVDYVVTEHGIAHLWGKTVKERARSLIGIAAPQFRDQLYAEFKEVYGRDCRK
ncbi:MAG: 4-hydroxybutyrate CoA-transferase [Myxococcota bacterium]|jgi:4-hydroxybutyrate CoA-transferase|nr:4-hydroxybutyrate CoA-transferase [Myxococcota bacterium]